MGKTKIGTMKHLILVEGDVNLLQDNEILVSREDEYPVLRRVVNNQIETYIVVPLKDIKDGIDTE